MKGMTLDLDARIPEEAVLLEYLDRLPSARRQEHLRRLLLLGFQQSKGPDLGNTPPSSAPVTKRQSDPDILPVPANPDQAIERLSDMPPLPITQPVESAPTLASLHAVLG